jgi:hypothetical protein
MTFSVNNIYEKVYHIVKKRLACLVCGKGGGGTWRRPEAKTTHDCGTRQAASVVRHPAVHLLKLQVRNNKIIYVSIFIGYSKYEFS